MLTAMPDIVLTTIQPLIDAVISGNHVNVKWGWSGNRALTGGNLQSNLSVMKKTGFFILLSAFHLCAKAQYSIDWSILGGGGGTSTGGAFTVSGTIGQPGAGLAMTNGQYSVTGGFWALYAMQTPGAPLLIIVASGPDQAMVSWSPATTGWVLQEALILSAPAWTNSPSGATNPIVVPATLPARFYRLHKP